MPRKWIFRPANLPSSGQIIHVLQKKTILLYLRNFGQSSKKCDVQQTPFVIVLSPDVRLGILWSEEGS
jgi:hypothetical protein